MFQEAALMPWLTAARNVELALRLGGVPRADRRRRTAELLELVRLAGVGDKRPHELSGGMRQRVALARALACTVDADAELPSLLLMDEPFSALDAITRDVLQAELLRIWAATGTAVLFVTHDVREAVRLGQRVVLLSSRPGRVVQEWRVADRSAGGGGRRGDQRQAARGDQQPCRSLTRPQDAPGPVAVADYGAVEAGLDALELPAGAGHTHADRLRRFARSVLPPVLAIVVLIAIWQALWAAAFWPEYQLPAPKRGRRRTVGRHRHAAACGASCGCRCTGPCSAS